MGVILNLVLVDHQRIVVEGLPVLNEAILAGDPDVLRRYLLRLPVEVNDQVVAFHEHRLKELKRLRAPAMFAENEARMLDQARGGYYQPEALDSADFETLRELMGSWCWQCHEFELDKSWKYLQWFLCAESRGRPSHEQPPLGHPEQSLLNKALRGSEPYPTDVEGKPVIRTRGTDEPGCTGYVPPHVVAAIHSALQEADSSGWQSLLSERARYNAEYLASHDRADDAAYVPDLEAARDEMEYAREMLPTLQQAYATAAKLNCGVSCEYSL